MNLPEPILRLFTEGKVGDPLLTDKNWPASLKGHWNLNIIPQRCHGERSHLLQQMAYAPKLVGCSTSHPTADAIIICQFRQLNCSAMRLSTEHRLWKI